MPSWHGENGKDLGSELLLIRSRRSCSAIMVACVFFLVERANVTEHGPTLRFADRRIFCRRCCWDLVDRQEMGTRMDGVVKAVLSGDTLVIQGPSKGGPPAEKQVGTLTRRKFEPRAVSDCRLCRSPSMAFKPLASHARMARTRLLRGHRAMRCALSASARASRLSLSASMA